MGESFPQIITNLRKKRGLSQKNAAAELNISQALLSHYEKGIRECGLPFLMRAADFYGVTTDYLLGRSQNKKKENQTEIQDIANALNLIFEIASSSGCAEMAQQANRFFSVAVYRFMRLLLDNAESEDIYSIPKESYYPLCTAKMRLLETERLCALNGSSIGGDVDKSQYYCAELTYDNIKENYPDLYASLLRLTGTAERYLQSE